MKEITVNFKTLTPLWTGDAWGENNKLKLTGIIGSLRWWFEALVRGMGYYACDSTSNNKCQIEIKNPEVITEIYKNICPACYLFGTTGWKSRLSVSIEEGKLSKPYSGKVKVKVNGGKHWHYESGLMGSATLRFSYEEMIVGKKIIGEKDENLVKMSSVFPSVLKILLYLISEYGMLGAKTSMGYGVVKFQINDSDIQITEDDWKNFENFLSLFKKQEIRNLPNLEDMFFVKFGVNSDISEIINYMNQFYSYQDGIVEGDVDKWKDDGWVITSPLVRKHLREVIRNKFSGDNKLRHFLMGKVAGKNTKFSAIQVSHLYKNGDNLEFRIWGWLPDKWPVNGKSDDILQLLKTVFNGVPWNVSLPSSILDGMCYENGSLGKVDDKLKQLFINGEQSHV